MKEVLKKVKVKVQPVPTKSPIRKTSGSKKIQSRIVVDEPDFLPKFNQSTAILLARTTMDSQNIQRHIIPHRLVVGIDCGFSIDVNPGYCIKYSIHPDFAARGLILADTNIIQEGTVRAKVWVVNVGKEIIIINHKQPFAHMNIEPVFSWEFCNG